MGHKTSPIGLRLQINRTWDSRWYAEGRNYAQMLKEDLAIRKFIVDTLPQAAISKVVIERPAKLCRVSIYAARPGVIIGKKGADIEKLRSKLAAMTSSDVKLNIVEIRKPEIDAKLVAQGIADQLVRRVAFRRAMRKGLQGAQRAGAKGQSPAFVCRPLRQRAVRYAEGGNQDDEFLQGTLLQAGLLRANRPNGPVRRVRPRYRDRASRGEDRAVAYGLRRSG